VRRIWTFNPVNTEVTMNFLTGMLGKQLGTIRLKIAAIKTQGQSNNGFVFVKSRKATDLSTEVYDVRVAPEALRQSPEQLAKDIEEAVNSALKKDMEMMVAEVPGLLGNK